MVASSGLVFVSGIIEAIHTPRSRGTAVVLYWILAHEKIQGNEAVDIAAKQATGWRTK